MIPVREQWCVQIEITNKCRFRCSNCTRFCAQIPDDKQYFMTFDQFKEAVDSLVGWNKVIGIMGGEPTLHPEFPRFVEYFAGAVKEKQRRGIWSAMGPKFEEHKALIRRSFGYFNINPHTAKVVHQPALVAIKDVVKDPDEMWRLINHCWLQRIWSSSINPKGVFFCEVAAAMDMLFDGPGGLPVEEGWWDRDLEDFQSQIAQWCPRCGIALPLEGRSDKENRDDVSATNLEALKKIGSPRVEKGEVVLFDPEGYSVEANTEGWRPNQYIVKVRPK